MYECNYKQCVNTYVYFPYTLVAVKHSHKFDQSKNQINVSPNVVPIDLSSLLYTSGICINVYACVSSHCKYIHIINDNIMF